MKPGSRMGCLEFVLTKISPVGISIVTLLLSIFNFHITSLIWQVISFVVAPSILHLVDNVNQNEQRVA